MGNFIRLSILLLLLGSGSSILADESHETLKKAAIGGGVGGALGGVIGAELGDRKGAIVGAAVGAALGATIATADGKAGESTELKVQPKVVVVVESDHHQKHPKGRHCPPGQAKKGRC